METLALAAPLMTVAILQAQEALPTTTLEQMKVKMETQLETVTVGATIHLLAMVMVLAPAMAV